MPKPSEIIRTAATLMNDPAQTQYTNANCLELFNLALNELQEIYELNDIPTTHKTTGAGILIKAGIGRLGIDTNPSLPSDFIEPVELWEAWTGTPLQWIPMVKGDFIPHYLENDTLINQFLVWAWKEQSINLIPANQDNYLKIDYIGRIFNTPILIGNINVNLPFTNIKTYLDFKTAALCAMFIAENPTRAAALDSLSMQALSRALGIPIKGQQAVVTRRMPFRYHLRSRGTVI